MDSLSSLWSNFAEALATVLPTSPFKGFLEAFSDIPYLGWLNWFVPFRAACTVFAAWLVCYALYLLYSIAMRWLKVIGD